MHLERTDEAARNLDAYQRIAAETGDDNALEAAVKLRSLLDSLQDRFGDRVDPYLRMLRLRYEEDEAVAAIGTLHLQIGRMQFGQLIDDEDHQDTPEELLLPLAETAIAHLLAGCALMLVGDQDDVVGAVPLCGRPGLDRDAGRGGQAAAGSRPRVDRRADRGQ